MEWDHPATVGFLFHSDGRITLKSTGKDYPVPPKGKLYQDRKEANLKNIFANLFVPNPDKLRFVVHKDDITDHRPSNLYWSNENLDEKRGKEEVVARFSADFPVSGSDSLGEYKIHPLFPSWRVY